MAEQVRLREGRSTWFKLNIWKITAEGEKYILKVSKPVFPLPLH